MPDGVLKSALPPDYKPNKYMRKARKVAKAAIMGPGSRGIIAASKNKYVRKAAKDPSAILRKAPSRKRK